MAKNNTLNYDEIRVGNTLMVEAREYAQKAVKQFDEDEQQFHFQRLVDEKYEQLVREHNATAVGELPLSGVQVTQDNKNVMVTRYTLKDGVSKDDAKAVLAEHEQSRTSMSNDTDLQKDMTDADFDEILKKAFVIHDVTMEEAASNRRLKRFAADCLIDEPEIEPLPQAAPKDPFAPAPLPAITGEALTQRLDQLGKDFEDLAISIEVPADEVAEWLDNGVPEEHKPAVFSVLSEQAVAAG